MASTSSRLGILGAGHVGPVIARLALRAGWSVAIANSGDPADLELITQLVVPGAEPRWAADAARDADVVVLAIPLHRFLTMDTGPLAGKLVVDAMNYWPSSDGVLDVFDHDAAGSSEVVAQGLHDSTVVKTLNHIGYHELEELSRPAGSPDRRAVGVAADDERAADTVATLVDDLGFDVVRLGNLRSGQLLQPGGPVFGVAVRRAEFEARIEAWSAGSLVRSGSGDGA